MNSFFYESTNKTDLKMLLLTSLSIFILVPILAYVYANLTWFMPIIYVNFLLTMVLGVAVSYIVEFVLWFGKCRSSRHALMIAIFAGLFTVYFQWAVWLQIVSSLEQGYTSGEKYELIIAYFINPATMLELMKLISDTGVWEIAGTTISGAILWLIWAIEAGIIIALIITRTRKFVHEPFCETSNKWATRYNLSGLTSIQNPKDIKVELSNKNYADLEALVPADEMRAHAALTFYHCEMEDVYYLTINNKIVFIGTKEVKTINNFLVEYIKIDRTIAKQLIEKYGEKESMFAQIGRF